MACMDCIIICCGRRGPPRGAAAIVDENLGFELFLMLKIRGKRDTWRNVVGHEIGDPNNGFD